MNILPSKKILSMLVLAIGLVSAIIITFGKETASLAISQVGDFVAGDKIDLPNNPEWESELGMINPNLSALTTQAELGGETATENVSRSLVSNYLVLKQSGELNESTTGELISDTINYVDKISSSNPKIPKLNMIGDKGVQSVNEYGEHLGLILKSNRTATSRNELEILEEAASQKNPKKIDELIEAINVYNKMLGQMEAMPVPKTFYKAHYDMVLGLQKVVLGLEEMRGVFVDPLMALQGIQKYQEGGVLFIDAIQASSIYIKQSGIVYKQGSGGYYLLYGI